MGGPLARQRRQRARRFKTEAEALAFDEGVSGGAAKPRSSTPNVYPYETSEGTRWRYSYRDSRGQASSKRGFPTERAAARDCEERMGRVRQGRAYVSRMTFGEFFPVWLRTRRPYLAAGTWADVEPRTRDPQHPGHLAWLQRFGQWRRRFTSARVSSDQIVHAIHADRLDDGTDSRARSQRDGPTDTCQDVRD